MHKSSRLPRQLAFEVAAILVVLSACSSGTQTTASQTAPAQQAPATLHWAALSDVPNTQCAGLRVPVDPAKPDGAKFTLRIARVPALNPSRKKGVLIFLPGGPGAGIPSILGPT